MRLALALILLAGCTTTRYSFRAQADEPAAPSEASPLEIEPTVIEIGAITPDNLLLPTLQLAMASGPVVMVISSPGGYVSAGLDFVDAMRAAQSKGVIIACVVPNGAMAASMAAYIFEACDRRLMARQASLLFHSVSISQAPGGTVDEIAAFARSMKELNDRLTIHIAGRLNVPIAYVRERMRGDWWLGWEEALEVGAVDEVVN